MLKKSLLQIVQDILNDLDADEVNSIDDTVESQQVAQIVRSCYEEMISNRNWPHLKRVMQLEAVNDLNRPNYLMIPEGVKELISFKYQSQSVTDNSIRYSEVKYRYPDEFLNLVSYKSNSDTNTIEVVDYNGVSFFVRKDKAPTYWTSFDDKYVVCDSYDDTLDDTLKKQKSQILAVTDPTWLMDNSFVPDLPSEAFSALQEEAKSTAFVALKQMANQKAEQKSARQQRWLSRKAWKANGGVRYEDYGRKNRR